MSCHSDSSYSSANSYSSDEDDLSPASVHFSQSQPQSLNLSNLENKKRSPEFNGKDGNISKKQKLCNVQRKKVVDKSGTSSNKSETAKDKDNIVCEFANVMRIDVAYEKALLKLKAIILAQVNKDCPNSTILQQRKFIKDCRDAILKNAVEKSGYHPVHKALYACKNYNKFITNMRFKKGFDINTALNDVRLHSTASNSAADAAEPDAKINLEVPGIMEPELTYIFMVKMHHDEGKKYKCSIGPRNLYRRIAFLQVLYRRFQTIVDKIFPLPPSVENKGEEGVENGDKNNSKGEKDDSVDDGDGEYNNDNEEEKDEDEIETDNDLGDNVTNNNNNRKQNKKQKAKNDYDNDNEVDSLSEENQAELDSKVTSASKLLLDKTKPIYFSLIDKEKNVNIFFTNLCPFRLSNIKKHDDIRVENPHHITCIVGDFQLICQIIIFTSHFAELKTFSFMAPSAYTNRNNKWFDELFQHMEGRGWCYVKTIENNYPGSNEHKVVDKRKIHVYSTEAGRSSGSGKNPPISAEVLNKAADNCNKKFANNELLTGGVHPTPDDVTNELIQTINPKENEVCWEIGVGYPKLAYKLCAVTKGLVVATDIDNVLNNLKDFL